MKKYEYLLCILSFLTLLFLIEFNRKEELDVFNEKFLLTETINEVETNEVERIYDDEVKKLKQEYNNNDVVATLEFLNTDYKVPVVQGNNNDYYLKHLPNKQYSIMGSIYADYRVNVDTSRKILIYGHNSSSLKMPFDILENYYDETYLNEHKYISIKTENKIKKYELFSIFIETSDFSYMNINFDDDLYLEHLKSLKTKSIYDIDVTLGSDTNILILQTCSTHKDYLKYKKKYLILAFKEIENVNID